jgi:multicomponent Na+:H+ antiporter subunit G
VDVSAIVIVLLVLASLSVLLTVIGVLAARNVYERLHFLAPAATVGVVCVTLAVLLAEGFDQIGIKALIAGSVVFIMNPILTHATARAARVQDRGYWQEEDPSS